MVVLLFIPYVVIKYEEMFMIVAMAMIMALEKKRYLWSNVGE